MLVYRCKTCGHILYVYRPPTRNPIRSPFEVSLVVKRCPSCNRRVEGVCNKESVRVEVAKVEVRVRR